MANFTLESVKALRENLGTGMVDTKNALVEADGDMDKAIEILRLKGAKGNAKRADRSTSEGLVAAKENGTTAYMIELACETDFVAKGDKFVALADKVLDAIAAAGARDVEAGLAAPVGSQTVAELIDGEAAIIGEKFELRRLAAVTGESFSIYLHKTSKDLPPQVGVVLGFSGSDVETARSVAQPSRSPTPSILRRAMFLLTSWKPSARSSPRSRRTRASRKRLCPRSLRDASRPSSSRSHCLNRTTPRTTRCPSRRFWTTPN